MFSHAKIRHLQACGLDPARLGARVGTGTGHRVYRYGADQVVKIPRFHWLKHHLAILTSTEAVRNARLTQEYLGEYVPATTVYPHPSKNSYCVVQQYLPDFQNLTSGLLVEQVALAKQFTDLLRHNRRLIEEHGLSVDFFGQEGTLKTLLAYVGLAQSQMANVGVAAKSGQPHLYLTDLQLFDVRRPENAHLSRRLMAEASRWGFLLNKQLAKRRFGENIG